MVIKKKNDWTMVPGWDGAKREYLELDCEQWIRDNNIRENGRENGKQNFPPADATQPDETYAKILDWVNKRGKTCHAEVSDYLNQQRNALLQETTQGVAPIRQKIEGLRDQGKVELGDQGQTDRNILTQKEREARAAWAELEEFKKKAGLGRVAEYEGRDTWYWWLLGVIMIETVANAMMLADVNEYGLVGAIIIMLMIGVVNAGILGGMIGEGWRQKNAVGLVPTLRGYIIVIIGSTGLLCWNLLVGHFRDSMLAVATRLNEQASLEELLTDDTIARFLNNPFGLEDMQSWILAVFGAGCCVFATTKCLKRDDVYPGYGTVHRAASDHSADYQQEIARRRADLESIYMKYVDRIRDELLKVQNKKGNHQLITDTAKGIVRQFPMQLSRYQDHLDFILAAYRSENEKARNTSSPPFFNEKFDVDRNMLEPPPWEDVPPPDYDEDWNIFQQAEEAIREKYLAAQAGYPTLEDLMEGESARERLEQ